MSLTVFTVSRTDIGTKDTKLGSASQMDAFLRDVEARAYRITLAAVRDKDDALDIVQETMIKLVRRYAGRPEDEWTPLFYRILKNRTHDYHRRQAVRRKVFSLFGADDENGRDPIAEAAGLDCDGPARRTESEDAMNALEQALGLLPTRQREAFVLRNFEGLNVQQTAVAMGCTDGSVKTHYSRAIRRLRELLGEHWQ